MLPNRSPVETRQCTQMEGSRPGFVSCRADPPSITRRPLPSDPNTNYVPEHRVPQLLCHQLSKRLSLRGVYISTTPVGPNGSPTLVLRHGQRTGAMGLDFLPLWHLQVEQGSLLGSRGPPVQLWPVLTCPAYSSTLRFGSCTRLFGVGAASKARRFNWFPRPACTAYRLLFDLCASTGATRRHTTVECLGLGGETTASSSNEGNR